MPLLARSQSELVECPGLQLSHPLFGDAQVGANLFQRLRLLAVVQAKPTYDNLLLTLVKARQNLADL